jgi:hypothetical protein
VLWGLGTRLFVSPIEVNGSYGVSFVFCDIQDVWCVIVMDEVDELMMTGARGISET